MKDNIFFILAHPIRTLQTKARQAEVAIEHASPPPGSTVEDFPLLPVQKAAKLLRIQSGVKLSDWPQSVQGDMRNGARVKPDGRHPEHQDI